MNAEAAPIGVRHDAAAQRFEADVEGRRAELDYQLTGDVMRIFHTEVPAPLQGRGIAAELARAALAHARDAGWRVQPACSYVRSYMRRHPETQDLLAS